MKQSEYFYVDFDNICIIT